MDGQRFDDALRALEAGVSRRRGLLTGLGALASLRAAGSAEAGPEPACRPNRMQCGGDGDCCSDACRNGWCAPKNGRRRGKGGSGKDNGGNHSVGNGNGKGKGGRKPKPTCLVVGDACPGSTACCAGLSCIAGACRAQADCQAVLTGAGCEFLSGPGVWNCGSMDLTGANVNGCDLTGASFFSANVSTASFATTILTGANFFGATVTGAVWADTTCPDGTDSDNNGNTCCGHFVGGQTPTGCAG